MCKERKKAAYAVFHFPHKNSTSRSTRSGAALDATLRLGLEPSRHREPRGARHDSEVGGGVLGRQEEADRHRPRSDARPHDEVRHPRAERVVALNGTVQPRISRPPVHPRRDVPVKRETLAVGDDARHPEPERGCPAAPREGVLGGGPAGEEGLAREVDGRIGIRNDLGRGHRCAVLSRPLVVGPKRLRRPPERLGIGGRAGRVEDVDAVE